MSGEVVGAACLFGASFVFGVGRGVWLGVTWKERMNKWARELVIEDGDD